MNNAFDRPLIFNISFNHDVSERVSSMSEKEMIRLTETVHGAG
jgi:hypothetical protein